MKIAANFRKHHANFKKMRADVPLAAGAIVKSNTRALEIMSSGRIK
jgi:ribosomal 50S subunit-recycling heat shock protein